MIKLLLLLLYFALLSALPVVAPAELLIYRGTERETVTGPNGGLRISPRVFVIIDHETGLYSRISYTTVNGFKRCSVFQPTNTHIIQVTGQNGRLFSAVTYLPTDCEAEAHPGSEGVAFYGANAPLTFLPHQTTSFPRTMTGHGMGLYHSNSSGQPYVSEGNEVLVFSQTETFKSNQAGEDLDAAFARIKAYIQSLGYIE